MRKSFLGYYRPTEDEFRSLWRECIFILDTNVLLNLYRYSPATSQSLLKTLSAVSDRLWLPHQVALEFQENRQAVISDQADTYDRVSKILTDAHDDLVALLSRGHLSIQSSNIVDRIAVAFQGIREELSHSRQRHPDLAKCDSIGDQIANLFEGKVGRPYPQDRIDIISKEGEIRYQSKIPPGYKDVKNGVKRYGTLVLPDRYGDFIIWLQIMDKAKEAQKPIVFITDERKEDWWWQARGKTLGPRPELVTEIMLATGMRYYMYTPNQFMELATESLSIEISQSIIDEIENTSNDLKWHEEVESALKTLGGRAHLSAIYDHIEGSTARRLPPTWRSIVRKVLQQYASNCDAFLQKEDLFVRCGEGYWELKGNSDR